MENTSARRRRAAGGGHAFCSGLLIIFAYDVDERDSSSSYLFISLGVLRVERRYETAASLGWQR